MAGVGTATQAQQGSGDSSAYAAPAAASYDPSNPGYQAWLAQQNGGVPNDQQSYAYYQTIAPGAGTPSTTNPGYSAPGSSGTTASAATNPLQPSYIPTPPQAQATTYTPATVGQTATYTNPYDPAQATSELQQAAGVQDQSQNSQLMSMLAAQGISPGSSAAQAAMQNLSGAQGAALDPSLAGVQENAAGLGEQSGLANMGALNNTNLTNQSALNTGGQYNAGANNTMTSQNLQDLLQQQEYNSGAYNSAASQGAGYQNQDWLAQLNAQLGLQTTGLNGANSLAGDQANQTVPLDPSLFSQITSGVGAAASAAAPFTGSFGGSSDPFAASTQVVGSDGYSGDTPGQ
jgi:hypothetical protein